MIALVEGAVRQKTPNEIALTLALSALTLAFMIVVIPLWPMAWNAEQYMMGYARNFGAPEESRHRRSHAGRVVGVPDSNYHRCAARGDRNRRHGSSASG